MDKATNIEVPEYESHVSGFTLFINTGVEPDTVPDGMIAHNEYIFVNVLTDGSNSEYEAVLHPEVLFFFVEPSVPFMAGKHDEVLYASMYRDISVSKIELTENLFGPDFLGVVMRVWSSLDFDEPICELNVAPLKKTLN